jgi:hypothetical protein
VIGISRFVLASEQLSPCAASSLPPYACCTALTRWYLQHMEVIKPNEEVHRANGQTPLRS